MKKLSRFLDMNFHAKSGVCSSKNGRVFALAMNEDTYTTTTTSKKCPPPWGCFVTFLLSILCAMYLFLLYTTKNLEVYLISGRH